MDSLREAEGRVYRFDDIEVDLGAFRVLKSDKPVLLEPKSFDVLVFLIEQRGRLVEKRELIDAVWNGAFVTDSVLTRAIAQLRRALGDDAKQARYIETVPTRGYSFIPATTLEAAGETKASSGQTSDNEGRRTANGASYRELLEWPMARTTVASSVPRSSRSRR